MKNMLCPKHTISWDINSLFTSHESIRDKLSQKNEDIIQPKKS
jgi:hypothetical protein